MPDKVKKQDTIRNVPRSVDQALRKKARKQQKSLNAVVLEALLKEAEVEMEPRSYSDLNHLIGTWISDPETEKALRVQRQADS